jgi:hypothetical protein
MTVSTSFGGGRLEEQRIAHQKTLMHTYGCSGYQSHLRIRFKGKFGGRVHSNVAYSVGDVTEDIDVRYVKWPIRMARRFRVWKIAVLRHLRGGADFGKRLSKVGFRKI